MSATALIRPPSRMLVEHRRRKSCNSFDSGYYSDITTDKDRRSSTSSAPSRDHILHLADPSRPTPRIVTLRSRVQNHPATLQCNLCPKHFTRAHNLRSHLRAHKEGRPFLYTVCGKAFVCLDDRR